MSNLGIPGLSVQPAIANVPVAGPTPPPYIAALDATARLQEHYQLTPPSPLSDGLMLICSMALDEEAPFYGVKIIPEQERQWPRSFRYGWPNIIATPSPVMVSTQFPGAFYLNYEAVVPQQVVDWVCLEAFRKLSLPLLLAVSSESTLGASVHYLQWRGAKGDMPSILDEMQQQLLSPFLMREAHTGPYIDFGGSV